MTSERDVAPIRASADEMLESLKLATDALALFEDAHQETDSAVYAEKLTYAFGQLETVLSRTRFMIAKATNEDAVADRLDAARGFLDALGSDD